MGELQSLTATVPELAAFIHQAQQAESSPALSLA